MQEFVQVDVPLSAPLPEHHEIVSGIRVRKAMPLYKHGDWQLELGGALRPCSVRQGGQWWLASECEIEFTPIERYLPDLAGWRVDDLPEPPSGSPVRTPPRWVCEILSPSTAERDRGPKQATYYAAGVEHYWLLDPTGPTLSVLTWAEDGYRTALVAGPGERIRPAPFSEIEIVLG
ncbi:MAG: Uma2 family endonuclease [Myxococcota bacterium]